MYIYDLSGLIQETPTASASAGTFRGLMELYENNYIKLRRLVPQIQKLQPITTLYSGKNIVLYLKIIEKHKYTTTAVLSYLLQENNKIREIPKLTVRICFDSRTAEVMMDENRQLFGINYRCRQRSDLKLKKRWQLNSFLHRWLDHCLKKGFRFNHKDIKENIKVINKSRNNNEERRNPEA